MKWIQKTHDSFSFSGFWFIKRCFQSHTFDVQKYFQKKTRQNKTTQKHINIILTIKIVIWFIINHTE